jgi:phosphoribosylamine--glycine ligase
MKSLIVGHGGREAALGSRMAQSSALYAFMGHNNPTLTDLANETGGKIAIGNVCDGKAITDFALVNEIDIVLVSSDDPLASGVVDNLIHAGVKVVGPTKAGAEIEWNKAFSRKVVSEISPQSNPSYSFVTGISELDTALSEIGADGYVVVKPLGLTGGKGVKVVGPHLKDITEARSYAASLLDESDNAGVIIEERIEYPEFTIQAMTDGKTVIFPPATYDYPYRFENDEGPGTGGMGSCSQKNGLFPFLAKDVYEKACEITYDAIQYLATHNRHFSGCMNAGFFATEAGPKVIEFNSRFGDPEAMNIMSLFDGDLIETLMSIDEKKLSDKSIRFFDKSSMVIYLVAPEYALGISSSPREFSIDLDSIKSSNVEVFFSSSERQSTGLYKTIGTSRAVAFVVAEDSLEEARNKLEKTIGFTFQGDLEWRKDIGLFFGGSAKPNP